SILNANAFVGAESVRNYAKPGSFRLRGWHYWMTLIAAFSGARLNEIMQMRVEDIRQVEGVWVFDFTDAGADQSLKTKASRRLVPVHPVLIDLDILAYLDQLRSQGVVSFFHDAPTDADGRRSTRAGKWFSRFLDKIEVKGQIGGMHRWRHTVIDKLRRAGYLDHEIAPLVGHASELASMTGQYGKEAALTISKR